MDDPMPATRHKGARILPGAPRMRKARGRGGNRALAVFLRPPAIGRVGLNIVINCLSFIKLINNL
jgi:hypothetical protein